MPKKSAQSADFAGCALLSVVMLVKTFGMRPFSIGETLPLFVTDVFSERKGFNCFDCRSLLRILDRFSEGEESARFIA